jgi:hypothetical protein
VEFASSPSAEALFTPIQQVNLPADLPPPLMQPVLQKIVNGLAVSGVPPVDYELLTAVVESCRRSSRFVIRGKIMACRMPDLQLAANVVQTHIGWSQHPASAP